MAAILVAFVFALCLAAVGRYWKSLLGTGCLPAETRLCSWALLGVAYPLLLWFGLNFGVIAGHEAIMRSLDWTSRHLPGVPGGCG